MNNPADAQEPEDDEEEEITEELEIEEKPEEAEFEPQEETVNDSAEFEQSSIHLAPEEPIKKITSPQDIPLNIVVEVGRLQMSVKTLMELKPGNLLDLHVHPETGVELVVNGTRVGKGELLQIGDTIGVRILELG